MKPHRSESKHREGADAPPRRRREPPGAGGWELFHRLTREEAEVCLTTRARQGFTVIQAVALAEFDGLNTPNRYGERPLADNDPVRPNEAYFAHLDWVVGDAGVGSRHLQATRAEDGSVAFVGTPLCQPLTVRTGLLAGDRLVAWWYDPRTGAASPAGSLAKSATHPFPPPEPGPAWVLVLDDAARGFRPPGAR